MGKKVQLSNTTAFPNLSGLFFTWFHNLCDSRDEHFLSLVKIMHDRPILNYIPLLEL